jgi:hypothetical protein
MTRNSRLPIWGFVIVVVGMMLAGYEVHRRTTIGPLPQPVCMVHATTSSALQAALDRCPGTILYLTAGDVMMDQPVAWEP